MSERKQYCGCAEIHSEEKKCIRVHTCKPQGRVYLEQHLESSPVKNIRYFPTDGEMKEFRLFPTDLQSCGKCRKMVTLIEAQHQVAIGKAQYFCKKKDGDVLLLNAADDEHRCEAVIVHVERRQTPRIDLITAADVERAVLGSGRKSEAYRWAEKKRKFEATLPENATQEQKTAWFALLDLENTHERRIMKQYREYIEISHGLALATRTKMFAGLVLAGNKIVAGFKVVKKKIVRDDRLATDMEQKAKDWGKPLFWVDDGRSK